MQSESADWKRVIVTGIIAGVTWGWISLAVDAISGAFPIEERLLHNLITFAVGGALIGVVAGAFLNLLQDRLPFKSIFFKAVFISTALWVILRIGGTLLSSVEPHRYHFITAQTVQGFILSVLMGCILGLLWRRLCKTSWNVRGSRV